MHLLIVNADDFGYSRGVNLGIIDAHTRGILTSTTLMANQIAFDDAIQLSKNYPRLAIGVHLTLTAGRSLKDNLTSLTNADGSFKKLSQYRDGSEVKAEELYDEWKAQIEKILGVGIKPSHLDSHHHIGAMIEHQEVFIKLAREYDLPMRRTFELPKDIASSEYYDNGFDTYANDENLKISGRESLVKKCLQYKSVEIGTHPGYIDDHLYRNSSYTTNRIRSLEELQNPIYPKLFAEHGITLGTFNDLQ